jgi:hypothetical protein
MTRRWGRTGLIAAACLAAGSGLASADIKVEDRTAVKFEGVLGGVVGLFGGKAAKEGVTSTVAIKGDRRARLGESTGEIVDLAEEKVYELDLKARTYKVTTFAEMRRRMKEEEEKARESAPSAEESPRGAAEAKKGEAPEKEYEVDFDVKDTGQKKAVNGFDTHQVVTTIAVREKGKTLEQGGGLQITADTWVAPGAGGGKDLATFEQRYLEKLHGPAAVAGAQAQMAMLMATYPALRQGLTRLSTEGAKMDGTPILTTMTVETVKSPQQMAQADAPSSQEGGGGFGGLRGKLGRKIGGKKDEAGHEGAAKNRSLLMTTTHEILRIAPQVSAADVAVPAGFQQK